MSYIRVEVDHEEDNDGEQETWHVSSEVLEVFQRDIFQCNMVQSGFVPTAFPPEVETNVRKKTEDSNIDAPSNRNNNQLNLHHHKIAEPKDCMTWEVLS